MLVPRKVSGFYGELRLSTAHRTRCEPVDATRKRFAPTGSRTSNRHALAGTDVLAGRLREAGLRAGLTMTSSFSREVDDGSCSCSPRCDPASRSPDVCRGAHHDARWRDRHRPAEPAEPADLAEP